MPPALTFFSPSRLAVPAGLRHRLGIGVLVLLHLAAVAILLHTEDELGFKLFDRSKGRLVPTPEAEWLFPEADRLFEDMENLRHAARDLRRGTLGTVRFAASAPPSLAIVPSALQSFRARHPEVWLLSYVVPADAIMNRTGAAESFHI